MASGFLYFMAALAFLLLVAGIVFFLVIYFGYKSKVKDDSLLINFMSYASNKRFIGTIIEDKESKDGRHIITYDPKDIDLDRTKLVEQQKIIVDKNKLINIPKSTLSRDKNIAIVLPPNASDFPDSVKETEIGKAFMWATELRNLINTETDMLREGHIRKDELLRRIGTGEISREFMKFQEELVKDALEVAINTKEKPKAQLPGFGGGSNMQNN